ncbi:MAG: sarcosine oxidase subunit gamma [Acetobacteraceae bacterium]
MSAPEPVGPFGAALPPGRHGASGGDAVRISARPSTIVQLAARRGRTEAVAATIRARFALDLPSAGGSGQSGDLIALWLQPETWLLMAPRGVEGALAREVKAACGDAGSVVDQTHGRAVLSISGTAARGVLGRICRIDLHPRRFGPGRVAATPIAELACLVCQRDATPSFDLLVSSSVAGWFAEAVRHAAAGSGYEIG